jgi:hypothetical protein
MAGRRKRTGTATVNVHVPDTARLFNTFDPSPFWDRDLDRDAAAFIEDEFSDKLSARLWHLNVHAREAGTGEQDLQAAIANYYARLAGAARRDLRRHLRLGELALLGGLLIFFACMAVRELLRNFLHELPRTLDEGLIILAWIALWRPAEALAYEWVPLLQRWRFYHRLAGVRVSVRPAQPEASRA